MIHAQVSLSMLHELSLRHTPTLAKLGWVGNENCAIIIQCNQYLNDITKSRGIHENVIKFTLIISNDVSIRRIQTSITHRAEKQIKLSVLSCGLHTSGLIVQLLKFELLFKRI